MVLTAEHDPLRDEGEAYAGRLAADGVRVEHRRFTSQMHGFFMLVGLLPGSAEAIDYVAEAIDRELSGAPAPRCRRRARSSSMPSSSAQASPVSTRSTACAGSG